MPARRGSAAAVLRIIPVAYSLVIVLTPRAPSTSAPNSTPTSDVLVGSNDAFCAELMSSHWRTSLAVATTPSANVATTEIPSVSHVERRVRNLVHSACSAADRTARRRWRAKVGG